MKRFVKTNYVVRVDIKTLSVFLVFYCLHVVGYAQNAIQEQNSFFKVDTSLLCRGYYFTPQQGRDNLNASSKTYSDKKSWEKRASKIRKGLIKGGMLEQYPLKTPLNAIIHSKRVYDGYTVENVYFESYPGFFVTGNLYKPTQELSSYAAVLSLHGHFKDKKYAGRFSERMQNRCAMLAKMGAIVFTFDMVGYGEAEQYDHFKHPKTHPLAFNVQLHNSMRALDFLLSQPKIDKNRVGMTGESSGGHMTYILTALDKRIKVSIPVVMASSYFYGGCTCDSGLPIHRGAGFLTSNIEFAAMAAPRPQLLISDGKDWTQYTPEVEYPYIRNIYKFYGKESNVENAHISDEGHDYGITKRMAAYTFFSKHLNLDLNKVKNSKGEIDESSITIEEVNKLKAFDDLHPEPAYAIKGEDAVTRMLARYLKVGKKKDA